LHGAEGAVEEVVEHERTTIVDFEPEFAAPLGESAFGDAEFGGDANEAPALRAELDKFLNCFLIFHTNDSPGHQSKASTGTAPAFSCEQRVRENYPFTNTLLDLRINRLLD